MLKDRLKLGNFGFKCSQVLKLTKPLSLSSLALSLLFLCHIFEKFPPAGDQETVDQRSEKWTLALPDSPFFFCFSIHGPASQQQVWLNPLSERKIKSFSFRLLAFCDN